MPAPTNTTSGTAVSIISLPYSITQVVDDAGTTYTVWYKFVAPSDGVRGVWGFGDLVTYKPTLDIYGPNSAILHSDVSSSQNKPVQITMRSGETWYFKFTTNAGNPTPANLQISVVDAPADAISSGSLLINDDTSGFPAAIISAVDGTVLQFQIDIVAGEQGDSILTPTPFYALTNTNDYTIKVYDSTFTLLSSITPNGNDGSEPLIRANKTLGYIYFLGRNSSNNWVLQRIDNTGAVSATLDTVTIGKTETFVKSFCVNNDATKLYINDINVIKTWDLATHAFTTNLATYTINYQAVDTLVLSDGTIVVLFVISGTGAIHLVQFDNTGAVLHDYDFGTSNTHTIFHHLAYSLNDPTTVWMWTHPVGTGTSRFREITLSTGVAAVDFTIAEYETGVYVPTATATPTARFGISLSCPFFMVAGGVTLTVTKIVVGGVGGESFDFGTTGGLSPSSFSLEDGQSQVFTGIAPGTYGVSEAVADGFTTTYAVTGDQDPSAILVEHDDIIVTVTNTAIPPAPVLSGIYKVVPRAGKRNDTVYTSLSPEATEDRAIPDPFFRTGLIGK